MAAENAFGMDAKQARMVADHLEREEKEDTARNNQYFRRCIAADFMAAMLVNRNLETTAEQYATAALQYADALMVKLTD